MTGWPGRDLERNLRECSVELRLVLATAENNVQQQRHQFICSVFTSGEEMEKEAEYYNLKVLVMS